MKLLMQKLTALKMFIIFRKIITSCKRIQSIEISTAISDTIHTQEGILHDEIKGVVRGDDRTTGKAGEGPTFKYDTAYLNRLYADLAQTKKSNALKIFEGDSCN